MYRARSHKRESSIPWGSNILRDVGRERVLRVQSCDLMAESERCKSDPAAIDCRERVIVARRRLHEQGEDPRILENYFSTLRAWR